MTAQNQDHMRIRVDFNNMMEGHVKGGINEEEIESILPDAMQAAAAMRDKRPEMKWRELPYQPEGLVADIEHTARHIAENYENFVVLGIGGSALGPIAVQQALQHLHYNELPREKRGGPRLFVEDNIDPERMAALLDVIDISKTVFNVISKSGSTSETMAQLLIVFDLIETRLGKDAIRHHLIATTDEKKGNLIRIAREHGLKTFHIPDGVGGRFSELCPVGLLPAAVCQINIRELLKGAAYMDRLLEKDDIWENPAYMLAALMMISMKRGMPISVMMPYADSLKYIADWYAQLWAESLGKRYDREGKEIYAGQTPVKALGVTDQHSQVQLYTEGPFDKVITFLQVERYRKEVGIPKGFIDIPDVSFLGGHTLSRLLHAEQFATEYAVMKSGHLNNTIVIPEVTPFTIGQLLYMLEVQTAFAGELLQINAFDQPGVEEGKNATYALLGKPGFDAKRKEMEERPQSNPRYII